MNELQHIFVLQNNVCVLEQKGLQYLFQDVSEELLNLFQIDLLKIDKVKKLSSYTSSAYYYHLSMLFDSHFEIILRAQNIFTCHAFQKN
jgi:hypothetical protein